MVECKVTIHNNAGIHCRPSSVILTECAKTPEINFTVITENGTAELKSILFLLTLGLKKGDTATLRAEGPGEAEAIKVIASLFEKVYDFPPK